MCILFISPVYGSEENEASHYAEENENSGDVIIPPGMETIKEGNVNVVVPKGGQLRKQGSVMLIETADEYASRKFSDTEEHFKRIEKELETQKKELKDLKDIVKKTGDEKKDLKNP